MAVQKNNADVVYYSTDNGLWKSINGGSTWTALLSNVGPSTPRFRGTSPIMIRSNNASELWFAGPRNGMTGWLWKSSDGGTTWAKAGGTNFDTNKARTLHNVATYANQIWVGSDNGLYVSTDGGLNFSLVGGSGRLTEVGMIQRFTSGAFAGVGLVTRSNNGGGGISRITATNYANAGTYTVTDAATSGIYFGYPTGLQIFSDGSSSAWNTSADRHGFSPAANGGQTFTVRATTLNTSVVPIWTTAAEMTAKNHPDYGTDQVIEAVGNANKWMITGGGAPMYSMDKGLSWQYFPNGSGLAAVKSYLAGVSRFDVNRMYIPASDIGSAIVTDGGVSGQATLSSHKTFTSLHGTFRILEGPNSTNLVIAGVNQGANSNTLLKSADGGANWTNFSLTGTGLPASTDGITKSVMSLTDANDFLVVLSELGSPVQRVYRTTNGGTNFGTVTGLPDNSPTGGRYGPQNCFIERDATLANVRYFVARGQSFYKSTTSGASWTAATHPFGTGTWVWGLHSDPVRSNNLWAAGDDAGVKVSRDGGVTWTSTATFYKARYVSSCDGKIAIFGSAAGDAQPRLYYSTNDGATFTALTTSTNNFHGVQGITVDRNGKVWVSWNSVTVVTPVTITDTQKPTAPTNLLSSNVSANSFTLNWTASTDNVGVTGYEVFRDGVSQGTVAGTTYNATGLTASTAYSYTVKAKDAANNLSDPSSALIVTTTAVAMVSTPTVTSNAASDWGEPAPRAFDGNNGTYWSQPTQSGWWQVQYPTAVNYDTYSIVSSGDGAGSRDLKDWTIQGSNDGGNWTVLDTRNAETWSAPLTTNTYVFTNADSYLFYRLAFSANNGNTYTQAAEITFDKVAVLPVSLVNFSGKATTNGNILSWRTVAEVNNSGFEVLRSKNGIEFQKIGFKRTSAVNGNSTNPLDYSFNDVTNDEDVYYKLNQIDINGKSTGSPIIVVKAGFTTENQLYPNPIIDELNVVLNSSKIDIAIISIVDQTGKVVIAKQVKLKKGKNTIQLNSYKLSAGWYLVNIKNALGEQMLSRKIIKF